MKTTKSNIIERLSKTHRLKKSSIESLMNDFIDIVYMNLLRGKTVSIDGLFTITPKYHSDEYLNMGKDNDNLFYNENYDRKTGMLYVPAGYRYKIKMSKKLKQRLKDGKTNRRETDY